jgi:hypothetical protein
MTIRVYYYGFAPNERIEIRWHPNTSSASYEVLKIATVAENGRASTLVVIPISSKVGDHKIVGKVIGVSRSASTTFEVTGVAAAEEPDVTETPTPSPTATVAATPTFAPTVTPAVTPTSVPTEVPIATPTVEPTMVIEPTPMPTPVPAETPTDVATTESVPDAED